MKTNAIYPGTFDPITFGHIDVIKKSLKIVDKVIVAISDINNKNYLFSAEERIESNVSELLSLGVKSDFRKIIYNSNKLRISQILFCNAANSLMKDGYKTFQIITDKNNDRAISFYKSFETPGVSEPKSHQSWFVKSKKDCFFVEYKSVMASC